jgi:hypothetical protein
VQLDSLGMAKLWSRGAKFGHVTVDDAG